MYMPKNEFPLEREERGRNQYACYRNQMRSKHYLRKFDPTKTRIIDQEMKVKKGQSPSYM
jgi:hypothetical protein